MSALFDSPTAAARPRRWSLAPYDTVRVVLGVVLLAAAALKGYELATSPVAETSLFRSWWFLIAIVEFELFFGLWLLAGLYPKPTRWAAMSWFAALLGLSLTQAVSGAASCACFGPIQILPWVMVIFDAVAVLALWFFEPELRTPVKQSQRLALLAASVAVFCVGIPGALVIASGPRGESAWAAVAAVDLGTVRQGASAEAPILIENNGAVILRLDRMQVSCDCLKVEFPQELLGPGQSIEGLVRLDLQTEKTFSGSLEMHAAGFSVTGERAMRINVRATVQQMAE
jgi:hypothetical protein